VRVHIGLPQFLEVTVVKLDLAQPYALSFFAVVSSATVRFAIRFSPMVTSSGVMAREECEQKSFKTSKLWRKNEKAHERRKTCTSGGRCEWQVVVTVKGYPL
jgi:hypothetical protein